MEAVPKLPLISFELKVSPENTQFGPKLKQYIAEAYREDAESYNNEIHQLEGLRSAAVRPTTDSAGLCALYRYFCQLRSVQSRFPMAKGQPAACSFSWKDLYANMTSSLADIRVEMACILYNIGALHTQLGSSEPRNTAESLKAACTHYQNAAWAFQYLKEQYPQPPGVDVSTEIMRLLQKICFAQAQECILEKSIQDTRKPSVVGAVATQVLIFYKNSLSVLGPSTGTDNIHEIIGTKLYNYWHRFLSFKSSYIGCIVCLYQGIHAEEQQKMGERVAFYQQAVDRLADARKLVKYIEPPQITQEALTFTNDVVEGKRKAAKNENEFIYHEEVPEKDLLMEMKPVCLVKAIPINFNDPEISGPDIFSRLVPICAHEASSLYSEEKAKLLRSIVSQAEAKNTELTEFMSSLQLDQLEVIDSEQKIPQEIVDRCAAMNAKTEIIQSLVDSMNNLAEIISDVEHSLTEIKTLIQEETMKEKEYQKTMGPRPPSIVQTELSREYHKYHEAHARTNESNQVLHKAMTLHIANLKLLSQPLDVLQSKIPSIDCIEGLDRETMTEMRRVVGKAREMQIQRDSLIQQLREDITSDDITSQLLARSSENNDDIFKQELEKHTPKVKIIEQNLAAQENIINKLTSLYASYGESRRLLSDVLRKREGLVNALITSYDTYEELLGKAQKGMEFYKKLSHNVNQLLTRLKGTCQVQEEERSQLLAKNSKPSTPTPTASPKPSDVAAPIPSIPLVGGGRKLKDYLPYMQNRGRRSVTPQAQVEPMPAEMYYPESIYPTSVRPAPVGSEATDIQMQLPDGGIMPMQGQSNPYDRYAAPYAASESDSYASQQNYAYPTTSKDYDKSEMNPYGYSAYIPHQFASQVPDQSRQIYSNPYYSATQNNGMIVTDSQNTMQYQAGVNQANMNQAKMNQASMNQANMNQANMNQANMNQANMDQANMNQANMNQANMNHPSMSQANIPNQYSNNHASNQPSANSNQYANPSINQTNMNPSQFAYESYMSTNQANPIPDIVPGGYSSNQSDLNVPFSQMHIAASKPETPNTLGDYTQTYYSVQYPQSHTPYLATYSHAPQTANTSMVSAPSDYSSLNYPYSSDSTQYGQTPNTSIPYSADQQYLATTGFAIVSQGYPTYTQANTSVTSIPSVADGVNVPLGYSSETDPNYVNPSLAHLYNFDKPIKSHVKKEALSSIYNPNYQVNPQVYTNTSDHSNVQNLQTSQVYTNPNEPSNNQNVQTPQMYSNPIDQNNIQNVQTPQVYTNPNDPSNNQNVQTPQMYSNPIDQNNIQNVQTPQVYTNPNDPSNNQNVQTPQMYSNPIDQSKIQNVQTPQLYANPNDPSNIQNVQTPQMYSNPIEQNKTQNVQTPQVYTNPNDPNNIQNVQTPQMYSNPNDPSNTQNIQMPQVYANQTDQSYPTNISQNQNYAQGYPGYTFDAATGNYAYAYGSQNIVSHDQGAHANVNPQVPTKDPNWSAQGVYTSASTCETVQSPSHETPPTQPEHPTINQQIYYNSPYGYVTNPNQANNVVQNAQSMSTNYGVDMNQSTYMQSGQHGHDSSVTNANNQVSTPKENVTEPPNFEHSRHGGYNQTDDSHTHDQNINQPSNDGGNAHDQNMPNAGNNTEINTNNQNVGSGKHQNTVDDQNTSNQVSAQNQPVNQKPAESIPETKSEQSVFDLLADIDFTVEHKPLKPEIKVPQISENAIKRPAVMPKEPVKKTLPKEEILERPAKRNLFSDPSLLNTFTQEVKNLQKLTDSLTNVTAGGLTVLDAKWKTFQDVQNQENLTRSKKIARQNSTGSIVTEVVPYDDSRLTLKSDPDAYINASYYKQLAPWCIPLVISKNPNTKEYDIFWKAVLENKISCVVCLLSEIEMQGKSYWPTAKGQSLELSGGLNVTLDEVICNVHWTERKLTVASGKSVLGVTHYQINVFPAKIVCSPLVLLVDKVLGQTYSGRASERLLGAWVQCGAGAGRSALVALLVMLLCQVRAGQLHLCDMLDAGCINLIKHRSNVLEDTKYLADAYRTALFYVQGVLCSGTTSFNGEAVSLPSGASILPPVTPASTPSLQKQKFSRESFEEMKQSPGLKSGDMKDPLNFLDPLWSLKKK